jgi:hypothetical protein
VSGCDGITGPLEWTIFDEDGARAAGRFELSSNALWSVMCFLFASHDNVVHTRDIQHDGVWT